MKVVIDKIHSNIANILIEVATSRVTICKQNKKLEEEFPVVLELNDVLVSTFSEWENTKDVDFALYATPETKNGTYRPLRVSLSKNVRCTIVD